MDLNNLKQTLLKERETLKSYIQGKLDSDQDWHAIIDAAMDLRDIDAKLEIIVLVEKELQQMKEDAFNSLTKINDPKNSLEVSKLIRNYNNRPYKDEE